MDSDHHALETFQRILKRQCDALIDLGFDPTVKVGKVLTLSPSVESVVLYVCRRLPD